MGEEISTLGNTVFFAVGCSVNANDQMMERKKMTAERGFTHAPVIIEDDCWFGVHVAVNKGVVIGEGSVICANGVVTSNTEPYSIYVGIPAGMIDQRK